jgi:cell division protein FtsW
MMLGGVCVLMIFIGGVPLKHMSKIIAIAIGAIVVVYILGTAFPDGLRRMATWKNRINEFVGVTDSAEASFQSDLAQYAIYDGGLIPHGPGSGTSRNFLPHPYSDMIYAFIIQEYGSILGGIGLILLYLIFLFRTIKTSLKCPKHFGGIMAMGLGFLLTIQALFNMAVSVHLMPVTGQPLPLVSMGGTSILFTCMAIGIILSVSRSVYQSEEWEAEDSSSSSVNKPREGYAAT